MTAALVEGLEGWGEAFERVLSEEPDKDSESTWTRMHAPRVQSARSASRC